MCDEIDIDELVGEIKPDKYSLLCGNGLTKCVYGESWKNPDDKFYEVFLLDTLRLITEKELHVECSEKFFNLIRIEYGLKIFQYYQKLQKQIESTNYKYIPENFLKKFKNIYTLNYDVLIPRSNAKYKTHNDGFDKKAITAPEIHKRCKNNGLYYLHGAFHLLFNHQNKKYRKIIRTNNDDLLKIIGSIYKKLKQHFKKPIILESKTSITFLDENDPLLVFASRSEYKLGAILTDDYLKHCYEKLEAEEKIVVFGCSFKNDEHILEALMSGESKEIYIGYYCDKDREYFINKLKGKSRFNLFNSKELCKRITKGENNDTRSE